MARAQTRANRKVSGGRYHKSRSKKLSELAGFPANSRLSETRKVTSRRTRGANAKRALLTTSQANVADKKGKTQKTQIVTVLENPANPHLVRRNILTKGALIETKLGKARVTSRPGQEGTINAVLV